MEIQDIFNETVYSGICQDIEYWLDKAIRDISRQIRWKKIRIGKHPHGQVLLALGLMAYTEYLGRFVPDNEKVRKKSGEISSRAHFDAFFRRLGNGYEEFLDNYEESGERCFYYDFRCKLVHEYFAYEDWTIAIPNNERKFWVQGKPRVEIQRPVEVGIGQVENGNYFLVLQKYYEDFKLAAKTLLDELKEDQSQSQHKIIQQGQYSSTKAGKPGDTG
jgi:hypothetical protein